MKRIYLYILFIVLSFLKTNAQAIDQKWLLVLKTDSLFVFVDSTNIKYVEDQITIVSLTQFRHEQFIASFNCEAKLIKSQILFNLSSKKYIVLGSLYYDMKLKIIGENSHPGFSFGNEAFSSSIDDDNIMKALFSKSVEILSIDTLKYHNKMVSRQEEKLQTLIDKTTKTNTNSQKDQIIPKENTSNGIISNNSQSRTNIEVGGEYNSQNEKKIRGTIFSDGQKFCFQVSSWKIKRQAENEVARLKSQGLNAFIIAADVPSKGGIWYRVRVGYFSSVEEAETCMRNVQ
jgi:hypothetical protein